MSIWALIDGENITTFEHLNLSLYDRILVLCGPRNKTLKIGSLPDSGFHHFEILRIQTQGKNNLDFHLAFHLGRLHQEAKRNTAFHIISKDHGYDGLIDHLKKLQRSCKRIEPQIQLSETALRVVAQLDKAGRTRPRKQTPLINWIGSRGIPPETKPEALLKELRQAGQLRIQDEAVTYTLKPA